MLAPSSLGRRQHGWRSPPATSVRVRHGGRRTAPEAGAVPLDDGASHSGAPKRTISGIRPKCEKSSGLHPPKSRPIDGDVILSPDSFPRIPSARSPPTPRDCGLRSPSSRPYPAPPEKTLSLPPPAPLPSPILRSGSAAADQATLVAVGSGALPPLHRHVKGASSSSLSDPLENPRILWTPSNKELPRHLHATRSLSCRCSPYHTSSPDCIPLYASSMVPTSIISQGIGWQHDRNLGLLDGFPRLAAIWAEKKCKPQIMSLAQAVNEIARESLMLHWGFMSVCARLCGDLTFWCFADLSSLDLPVMEGLDKLLLVSLQTTALVLF
uniref:Uncharacterized protein n=1 Tax=Oryza nivara TaxID=4536 RepID=A0A0E0GPY3_ORYNI